MVCLHKLRTVKIQGPEVRKNRFEKENALLGYATCFPSLKLSNRDPER